MNLSEFLLARIAEDEAAALEATGVSIASTNPIRNHIARHHPARVLAECEAKRAIVCQLVDYVTWPNPGSSDPTGAQALWIIKTLASPYADHPDYRDEWRP